MEHTIVTARQSVLTQTVHTLVVVRMASRAPALKEGAKVGHFIEEPSLVEFLTFFDISVL